MHLRNTPEVLETKDSVSRRHKDDIAYSLCLVVNHKSRFLEDVSRYKTKFTNLVHYFINIILQAVRFYFICRHFVFDTKLIRDTL